MLDRKALRSRNRIVLARYHRDYVNNLEERMGCGDVLVTSKDMTKAMIISAGRINVFSDDMKIGLQGRPRKNPVFQRVTTT